MQSYQIVDAFPQLSQIIERFKLFYTKLLQKYHILKKTFPNTVIMTCYTTAKQ